MLLVSLQADISFLAVSSTKGNGLKLLRALAMRAKAKTLVHIYTVDQLNLTLVVIC